MGLKIKGKKIDATIGIVIPLACIKEQPGQSFVTFDDAAAILKNVFRGCWGTPVYQQFQHEVMRTMSLSKASIFRCTIQLSTMSNMALPPNDAPKDFSSPDSVAEWIHNKIVNHLIVNNLVADDFAGHSVNELFKLLRNMIQAIPEA